MNQGQNTPSAQRPINPDAFEARLRSAAQALPYPPTPDLHSRAWRLPASFPRPVRAWAAVLGILLIVLGALAFSVPTVRAAVAAWLRVGAVQIFLASPTPTAAPTWTAAPEWTAPAKLPLTQSPSGENAALPTTIFTPQPTETPLQSVLDLGGAVSLEQARRQAGFPIALPASPADLGQPQAVFYQLMGGPVVVLAWTDPRDPAQARLVLSETEVRNIIFQKMLVTEVSQTRVNDQPAVWVAGPYLLVSGSGETATTRLIQGGHTLLWTEGNVTYRLETHQPLDEAVQTAESLR